MKSVVNLCITVAVDDKLLRLRTHSYEMGMKHDQALVACTDVLMAGDYRAAEHAVQQHTDVAFEYGKALTALNEHLKELQQTNEVRDERRRVERLLDLLDKETETLEHRLEIMKKSTN